MERRINRVTAAVWQFAGGAVGSLTHSLVLHTSFYQTGKRTTVSMPMLAATASSGPTPPVQHYSQCPVLQRHWFATYCSTRRSLSTPLSHACLCISFHHSTMQALFTCIALLPDMLSQPMKCVLVLQESW